MNRIPKQLAIKPLVDKQIQTTHRISLNLRYWLNYQHIASVMLLLIGISLSQRPSPALDLALSTLMIQSNSHDAALIFVFAAGILFMGKKTLAVFRITTLPLVIYGLILLWYGTQNPAVGFTGAAYGIGIWAILQIAALPAEARPHDTD